MNNNALVLYFIKNAPTNFIYRNTDSNRNLLRKYGSGRQNSKSSGVWAPWASTELERHGGPLLFLLTSPILPPLVALASPIPPPREALVSRIWPALGTCAKRRRMTTKRMCVRWKIWGGFASTVETIGRNSSLQLSRLARSGNRYSVLFTKISNINIKIPAKNLWHTWYCVQLKI